MTDRQTAQGVVEVLRADADSLSQLIEDSVQAIASVGENWEGGDSARFQRAFAGKRQHLHSAVQMLESMAKQLQQQTGRVQSTSAGWAAGERGGVLPMARRPRRS